MRGPLKAVVGDWLKELGASWFQFESEACALAAAVDQSSKLPQHFTRKASSSSLPFSREESLAKAKIDMIILKTDKVEVADERTKKSPVA